MLILAVNPGTQAEQQPQLRPGLILASLNTESVADKTYSEILGTLKTAGRPVSMSFHAIKSGEEAKERLKQHIAQHGMTNIPPALLQASQLNQVHPNLA